MGTAGGGTPGGGHEGTRSVAGQVERSPGLAAGVCSGLRACEDLRPPSSRLTPRADQVTPGEQWAASPTARDAVEMATCEHGRL